jgi:predicted NBD/HSP70 family sugar kinase
VDAASELQRRIGFPVHLDNDANLGALAEVTLGAGRSVRSAAYIQMSSGIGAGLIVDGRPYHGHRGTAGEIGHVLVDEHGLICRCGNRGCLETLASGPAMVSLLRPSHGELSVERMIEMARDGDPGGRRVIADAGRAVGQVVAGLCNLFNPEMVVVGGDLSAAGELLLDPLRASIDRYALPAATEKLEVVAGELGERANLLGALALAIAQSGEAVAARIAGTVSAA